MSIKDELGKLISQYKIDILDEYENGDSDISNILSIPIDIKFRDEVLKLFNILKGE